MHTGQYIVLITKYSNWISILLKREVSTLCFHIHIHIHIHILPNAKNMIQDSHRHCFFITSIKFCNFHQKSHQHCHQRNLYWNCNQITRARLFGIYSGIYSGYSAPGSRIAGMEIQVFRNENSSQTSAYSHYSNYSYSGLIPNERALNCAVGSSHKSDKCCSYNFLVFISDTTTFAV